MDKYSKRSIARLWIALAVLMVLCTTTETFAQTSAATDSISATTTAVIATLEETTVESSAPSTVGELVNGLNTVWMLLAAMLVFFMQPGFALVEAGLEHRQHPEEEFRGFHVRQPALLVHRFRTDVRRRWFRGNAPLLRPLVL